MTSSFATPEPFKITQEPLAEGLCLVRLELLGGPVDAQSWRAFTRALLPLTAQTPVLLETHQAAMPQLKPPEEQEWVLAAGAYRQAQEVFKARGGVLFSMVHGVLIGGVYLVHGLGASHRWIDAGAEVYPALPAEAYQRVTRRPYPHPVTASKALDAGLVTAVMEAGRFDSSMPQIIRETLRLG